MIGTLFQVLWYVLLTLLVIVSMPLFVRAQTDAMDLGIRNIENSVLVVTDPLTPVAGQIVHLKAESPLIDLSQSELVWRRGSTVIAQGLGVTEVTIVTDANESSLVVDVSIQNDTWGSATRSLRIALSSLDLLYDAPTYAPPFYRGRSVASTGSARRFMAVARFPRATGYIPDSEITFTWNKDGRTLASLSGIGKSSALITAPSLDSTETISVTASAPGGDVSASTQLTISSTDPIIALYEDHPLYGIMFHQLIPGAITVPGGEVTVAAIPYFATISGPEDRALTYDWTVNNRSIAATSTDRSRLTVRAGTEGGIAALGLHLLHAVNIFMAATAEWTITLKGSASVPEKSTGDGFHSPITP